MQFVTGSCVCATAGITVEFNALTGLGRVPIALTCSSTLELSTSYINYDDLAHDFKAIFAETNSEFSWRMDAI